MATLWIFRLLMLCMFFGYVENIKPIIYMHGIIGGPEEADTLKSFVQEVCF